MVETLTVIGLIAFVIYFVCLPTARDWNPPDRREDLGPLKKKDD